MTIEKLLERFAAQEAFGRLCEALSRTEAARVCAERLAGSARSVLGAAAVGRLGGMHLFILADREAAAYFYSDLYNLREGRGVLYLPSSYRRSAQHGAEDAAAAVLRTTALARAAGAHADEALCIVCCAEAAGERVASGEEMKRSTLTLHAGEQVGPDFVCEALAEYGFERVDFVSEPGQLAVRGSIIDVFSFSDSKPYRLDFFGNEVESIRTFNLNTQLSEAKRSAVEIIPNLRGAASAEGVSLFGFIQRYAGQRGARPTVWVDDARVVAQRVAAQHAAASESAIGGEELESALRGMRCVLFAAAGEGGTVCRFSTAPQPAFNKDFGLLAANIRENEARGFDSLLLTDSLLQAERLAGILTGVGGGGKGLEQLPVALHEGFVDSAAGLCCYTDHQLFGRHHRYRLHGAPEKSERLTVRELSALQPGDYVVHIDHGVGMFGGLVKQQLNGKLQEFVKLVYRDGDVLFVSVHGLHRISRYKARDGVPPKVYKLGTDAWQKLKNSAKSKVKDMARELVALYAQRKSARGFAFSADSYLQHELEASFIYEDTPDQLKVTKAVKADMEDSSP
ncbi:MAG: transcription-repair coupling factor, partial [Prevotellaceae bacterium]|nr:transcription-repair coupling factor [Prevotellaceae bacterium]